MTASPHTDLEEESLSNFSLHSSALIHPHFQQNAVRMTFLLAIKGKLEGCFDEQSKRRELSSAGIQGVDPPRCGFTYHLLMFFSDSLFSGIQMNGKGNNGNSVFDSVGV